MLIENENYLTTLVNHISKSKKEVILNSGVINGLLQVAIGYLKKNEIIETHSHESMNEFFFLLSGELQFFIEENAYIVKPKDSIFVMKKNAHSIKALSDSEFFYFNLEDDN